MAYDPPPGTIPAKVIAHLRSLPPGTKIRSAELVEAAGVEIPPRTALQHYLGAAVMHGAIARGHDPDDTRRIVWSLGDGKPLMAGKDDDQDLPEHRRKHRAPQPPRIDQLIAAGAPAVKAAVAKLSQRTNAELLASHGEADPHGIAQHQPGAKLDAGKVRPALVLGGFARALLEVSKVGTYGAVKYTEGGWTQVPDGLSRYDDAQLRHWLTEHTGQPADPDTELMHAAHAAWNALARLDLMLREIEKTPTRNPV